MFKTPNFQKAKTPSNLKVSNIKAAPQDLKERFNQFFERVIKLCKNALLMQQLLELFPNLLVVADQYPLITRRQVKR
ncbi:hypothetical protein A2863_04430 [Candidatus Woesebacteria bacterium RIFCSPHIGHO2_01_FULL_38_9b]|uniref:Uncharacterized protein n=1 Tax=Candidatus Woesebacteria bacterium RIFCSPHIGHO2_01_FULL_38_9b TaxID=1802493 RepID=A0A1F7XZA1_9BACT|nr:MAG: hypothetical protein A2863_04430 [Candidatus Woesebacteria bacterium RIFCSPHIGHO2_01_FULL_38_9b]